MICFLALQFFNLIKASIEKIPIDQISENQCTICLSYFNEISEYEILTEIESKETINYTYLFKCPNKHYFHLFCIGSWINSFFNNVAEISVFIHNDLGCPCCRAPIKYLRFILSIIDVIVSPMKANPDRNFDKIALISSIQFCSYNEFQFFKYMADLSSQELSKILISWEKIYSGSDQGLLLKINGNALNWNSYINPDTTSEDSSINMPADVIYLSKETLIDVTSDSLFIVWFSKQKDSFSLKFFESFVKIHKKYQSNLFLDYLKESIESFRFFKPHLFDKMLKILTILNPSLFDKAAHIFRKRTFEILKPSITSTTFFEKINQAIEKSKKSTFSTFLLKIKNRNNEEYQRIWSLGLKENRSNAYFKALCDQIVMIPNEKNHFFENLIIDFINTPKLSYFRYKIILDLIIKRFIQNKEKKILISEKIKEFLPRPSVFFLRYFIENLETFFLFKNSPGALNKFLIFNEIIVEENFELKIFNLEKKPLNEVYNIFLKNITNFVKNVMIPDLDQEVGMKIYRMCLVLDIIVVLGIKNKDVSDYFLSSLSIDKYFKVEKKICFDYRCIIEKATNKFALHIFEDFGNRTTYFSFSYRIIFIQLIFRILDFRTSNVDKNRIMAQNVYDSLKGLSFSYEILFKLVSISQNTNIFIADIAGLIVESFNDKTINGNQLLLLIDAILVYQNDIYASEIEKKSFISIIGTSLKLDILGIEELTVLIDLFFRNNVLSNYMIIHILLYTSIDKDRVSRFKNLCCFFYKNYSKYNHPDFHKIFIHFLEISSIVFEKEFGSSFFEPFHKSKHNSYDILIVYLENFFIKSNSEIRFIINIFNNLNKTPTAKQLNEFKQKLYGSVCDDVFESDISTEYKILAISEKNQENRESNFINPQ